MTDPQRPVGKTPPRAEPLQPDAPLRGTRPEPDAARDRGQAADDAPDRQRRARQEKDAVDNNREGFD